MTEQKLVDISPTTAVLLALTRTPITPLDALCELIDNAIDSFRAAVQAGEASTLKQVILDIPGAAEVGRGEGVIRIRDTGPGLTEQQIANALRAGYSSKNAFDTLGLFGMGFNIATGKIGRVTKLISARAGDDHALMVTLDLPRLIENGTFEVPCQTVPKPPGLDHGTVVEIRSWWAEGDPNSGFIKKLAGMTKDVIRENLGRRYATLLRGELGWRAKIVVNGKQCEAFEHCVWAEERFVERSGHGRIPAVIRFNEELGRTLRCLRDGTLLEESEPCSRCGGREGREVSERVWGWVGVQRFDDQNDFGIDLIRNGRAIRVDEKSAFFEHIDETTKKAEKEYPIDQQYGRLVGEVHLDHVPVDFQKQNFQQTTSEWQAAMKFLRGGSLLPSKWVPGEVNNSPVSRVFQGYRKVRNFGTADMYMGTYDAAKGKAVRIPREVERQYYFKFRSRRQGFYDDAEWWKLVETANDKPIEELPECPECGFENAPGAEVCEECAAVLLGKSCINAECKAVIAKSAVSCATCGASQIPEVIEPWTCGFCGQINDSEFETCKQCKMVRGAAHPASKQSLLEDSEPVNELSVTGLTITLANGKSTSPVDIVVRAVRRPIQPGFQQETVPLVSHRSSGEVMVFIDRTHNAFLELGLRVEDLAAAETAQYFYDLHPELIGRAGHSAAVLLTEALRTAWGDSVAETADSVRERIKTLFTLIADRLTGTESPADFYSELDETQQRSLAEGMIAAGVDLAELSRMKQTGEYLRYADASTLVAYFQRYPRSWFGGIWGDHWPEETEVGPTVALGLQEELTTKYLRCLEDCASYLRYQRPERLLVVRARVSADFLDGKLQ